MKMRCHSQHEICYLYYFSETRKSDTKKLEFFENSSLCSCMTTRVETDGQNPAKRMDSTWLSHHYVRGAKPTLVAIEGDLATLKFPNGTIMTRVPIRYICDDAGYWRN